MSDSEQGTAADPADPVASWQQWMQSAVMQPATASELDINNRLLPGANLSAAECLGIYQRSYILRLARCLAEQFPALCHALGNDLFDQFARRYLQRYPSNSYTLYDLGARFPDFLEEDRPDRDADEQESWIDFMIDLARYEWTHFSLFDAPGHEGKPWPTEDTPDERLVLQSGLALGYYRFPVGWYYHAIKNNPHVGFPPARDSWAVLVRKDYRVTTYPITQLHFQFLRALQASGQVARALRCISDQNARPMGQVTESWTEQIRGRWIAAGFFTER